MRSIPPAPPERTKATAEQVNHPAHYIQGGTVMMVLGISQRNPQEWNFRDRRAGLKSWFDFPTRSQRHICGLFESAAKFPCQLQQVLALVPLSEISKVASGDHDHQRLTIKVAYPMQVKADRPQMTRVGTQCYCHG